MRRVISILLAAVIVLTLCSCNKPQDNASSKVTANSDITTSYKTVTEIQISSEPKTSSDSKTSSKPNVSPKTSSSSSEKPQPITSSNEENLLNNSSINGLSSVSSETLNSQTGEETSEINNHQHSKDYTQAIDNYIDVFGYGNLENIGKIAPNAYWQFLQNQTNKSYDEIIDDLIKNGQYRIDMIESRYGDNVTTNYTILNKTEVSEEELQKITATLKDNYLNEDLCAEKGYDVKLEGHVKGTKFENKVTPTITVVQIDHNWYVIVYIERNNKANVLFMSEALFY